MLNSDKFKTVDERVDAFMATNPPRVVSLEGLVRLAYKWLDKEVKEESILPCPFCGKECTISAVSTNEHHEDDWWNIECTNTDCLYSSGMEHGRSNAISEHNRLIKGFQSHKDLCAKIDNLGCSDSKIEEESMKNIKYYFQNKKKPLSKRIKAFFASIFSLECCYCTNKTTCKRRSTCEDGCRKFDVR